jgi:hypothetical protein
MLRILIIANILYDPQDIILCRKGLVQSIECEMNLQQVVKVINKDAI